MSNFKDASNTFTGNLTVSGTLTGSSGINTKQTVGNVHDTTPTEAQLISEFGAIATVGAGFIGVVKDADADTNLYLVVCTGAKYGFVKLTVAS